MILGVHVAEVALFLIALAVYGVVMEACYRLGIRYRASVDDSAKAHLTTLQSALLGLLALLLGFTFAMAVNRFDARKSLVLEEANVIGRAYFRSQLQAEEHRDKLARLIADYTATRVDFHTAGDDPVRLQKALDDASRVEYQLRALATSIQANDPRPPSAALFAQALSDMAEVNAKRLGALENHVPEPVLHLLFIVSAGAIGFIAFGSGMGGRRRFVSTAIFATLIALVLTFIRDIDDPGAGLIRVDQESMIRLKTDLEKRLRGP